MGEELQINKQDNIVTAISNKQAEETKAAVFMAKKYPRDEIEAYNRIRKACKRKGLAKDAEYCYPRGSTKISGLSIRLAETIAQYWGNIDYGTIEISRKNGESEMMSYAWDLETNTRRTMVFKVKHIREKKSGNETLNSVRDIYEVTANMGARRLRACIMGIIPSDIQEDALAECRKTLSESYEEPLSNRTRKMVAVFDDKFGVSKTMIEDMFGYNLDSLSEQDYLKLISIHNSLKDGLGKREDWFKITHKAKSSLDEEMKNETK